MEMGFRPLTRADFPLLAQWLGAPHVQRWWREASDPGSVEASYGPAVDGSDPTEHFVVEVDGRPIGMVQRCRLRDYPDYQRALSAAGAPADAATLDYLIGEAAWSGRGLGPAVIAEAVQAAWRRYPEVVAIVIAVQQDNRPSWRALEKAGFRRAWSGVVDSEDPSDNGRSYVYLLPRPA
jgi:aminoglycoside 6'-N-acetyltransferase